jgi:hypothetical protein
VNGAKRETPLARNSCCYAIQDRVSNLPSTGVTTSAHVDLTIGNEYRCCILES